MLINSIEPRGGPQDSRGPGGREGGQLRERGSAEKKVKVALNL